MNSPVRANGCAFRDPAFMANRTQPVHRWVPWIAGYSRDFVDDALERHLSRPGVVLDPFAGVGTTLVEADLSGHRALGFEINPYATFAARVKLSAHRLDSDALKAAANDVRDFMAQAERDGRTPHSVPPESFRTRTAFYSPAVETKVLLLQDYAAQLPEEIAPAFRLAFASQMIAFSNYSYEPSLGRKSSAGRAEVDDYPVADAIASKLLAMAEDSAWYRSRRKDRRRKSGSVYAASFFDAHARLDEGSVDLLVTSPPYLNNYHYNRNTRPQLYWLGFCACPNDMKVLEELNFGSYWQNARARATIELDASIQSTELRRTLATIRQRNPDRGVYGGQGWANYAARYFNDCGRFADGIRWSMRRGGTALVVIGNSILQGVPVPTDRLLGRIAEERGLELVDIHVPRGTRVGSSIINSSVRVGSANGHRLYESIVELRRP